MVERKDSRTEARLPVLPELKDVKSYESVDKDVESLIQSWTLIDVTLLDLKRNIDENINNIEPLLENPVFKGIDYAAEIRNLITNFRSYTFQNHVERENINKHLAKILKKHIKLVVNEDDENTR